MISPRLVTLVIGILAIAGFTLHANMITNGGFENTNNTFVGDGNCTEVLLSGSAAILAWTATNVTQTAWIENGNPWAISAADGQFFLDLTSYADVVTYGGVTQSFATVAGTSYAATFDLGYGGNSAAFGGPVSVRATAGSSSTTFTSGSRTPNPPCGTWKLSFTATSSLTQLTILGLSTKRGEYIGLDNVGVELASPEPSYATPLLGIGFFACVAGRRLRRLATTANPLLP